MNTELKPRAADVAVPAVAIGAGLPIQFMVLRQWSVLLKRRQMSGSENSIGVKARAPASRGRDAGAPTDTPTQFVLSVRPVAAPASGKPCGHGRRSRRPR